MADTYVVKIGSGVLTEEGQFNHNSLTRLCKDIKRTVNTGARIVIVSSGAVALGRACMGKVKVKDYRRLNCSKETLTAQVLASIGQPILMANYRSAFSDLGAKSSQVLVTRRDFADRDRYINLSVVVDNLVSNGVIPVFNSNDVLTGEELDPLFGNNEQVGAMVSSMVNAKCMIILSDVEGLYDGPPDSNDARVIPLVENPLEYIDIVDDSSSHGRGGMHSKLLAANRLGQLGIEMRIASGNCPNVISRVVSGEDIGTFFPARRSRPSGVKVWLATAAEPSGRIMVSTLLADRMRQYQQGTAKGSSVLLIGVESVEGNFQEGDVVDICDIDEGDILCRGKASISADALRKEAETFRSVPETERDEWTNGDRIVVHLDNLAPL